MTMTWIQITAYPFFLFEVTFVRQEYGHFCKTGISNQIFCHSHDPIFEASK